MPALKLFKDVKISRWVNLYKSRKKRKLHLISFVVHFPYETHLLFYFGGAYSKPIVCRMCEFSRAH